MIKNGLIKLILFYNKQWEKVCYYRDHLDELPAIQEIADKRKIYKMNTDLTINNYDPDLAFLNFKDKVNQKM